MRERNRVDATTDVVQRTLSIAGGVASLLKGDRSQDDLEAIFDAMLHFAKEHVPALRLHSGGCHPCRLAEFTAVALEERADQCGGSGGKLDRVLTEIARASAVHLQHAPSRTFDQHRHIDQ